MDDKPKDWVDLASQEKTRNFVRQGSLSVIDGTSTLTYLRS